MTQKNYHANQFSVRPEGDLADMIEEWLAKNPGWSRANLGIQAVMKFITEKQVLEPVKTKESEK